MKTGDYIKVHNPFNWRKPLTYLSWVIRKLTGSFYNHAAILVEDAGMFYVVEATYPRVIITEFERWKANDRHRVFEIVEVQSKYTEAELIIRIFSQLDKKYDVASLFNILFYLINGKWHGRTGEGAAKKLYCFELVDYVHGENEFWKVIPRK